MPQECLLHRREAAPVMGCSTEAGEGCAVFRRRVAPVAFPSIARVALREPRHEAIARHFGENGGGGDGEARAITSWQAAHRAGKIRRHCAVDQCEIGAKGQPRDRAAHRKQARAKDV